MLKRCPFCGGKQIEILHGTTEGKHIWYRAFCTADECGGMGPPRLHKADAERIWNIRSRLPELEGGEK